MEPASSLPYLQLPAIYPYREPDQSSPCSLSHLLKIHLNIILPSKQVSSKYSLFLTCSQPNRVYTTIDYDMVHNFECQKLQTEERWL